MWPFPKAEPVETRVVKETSPNGNSWFCAEYRQGNGRWKRQKYSSIHAGIGDSGHELIHETEEEAQREATRVKINQEQENGYSSSVQRREIVQ
jgi:hypothetical protein